MGGRGEHLGDDVVQLQVRPDDAAAAPPLPAECVDRLALHVAASADRDDDVLVLDEVLLGELPLCGTDLGAPWVRVLPPDLEQLLLDHTEDRLGILQQSLQPADGGEEFLVLVLELLPLQLRQAPQRHVQDVVGLDLRQLELGHELGPGLVGVGRRADDTDDLVDVCQRDQEALDDVIALFCLAQIEPGSPRDDVDLVVDVALEDLLEVERPRDAVDQSQHDGAEALLELGVLVELVQDDLRVGALPEVDDQTHPGPAGLVFQVRDVVELARIDELGDLLGEPRLVDQNSDSGQRVTSPPRVYSGVPTMLWLRHFAVQEDSPPLREQHAMRGS